jgi:hypothetical protein
MRGFIEECPGARVGQLGMEQFDFAASPVPGRPSGQRPDRGPAHGTAVVIDQLLQERPGLLGHLARGSMEQATKLRHGLDPPPDRLAADGLQKLWRQPAGRGTAFLVLRFAWELGRLGPVTHRRASRSWELRLTCRLATDSSCRSQQCRSSAVGVPPDEVHIDPGLE